MKSILLTIACLIGCLAVKATFSATLVRMEFQQGAVVDLVDLKLYDEIAPLTVANFLNLANGGNYTNSFMHRSVPGFIIQGGGFTFDPLLNNGEFLYDSFTRQFSGGLQEVEDIGSVVNEFNKSNVVPVR
jgi:cyclophilin family peptidyl-prolyl cis-trans isomerase